MARRVPTAHHSGVPFFRPCEAISEHGTREPPHEARKRLRGAARAPRTRTGPTPFPSACANDANEGLKADFLVGPQTPTPRPPPRMGGPTKKCATKGAKRNQARQRPITAEAGGARGVNDASITAAKPLTYNGRLAGGPRDDSKAAAELPPAQRAGGAGAAARHNDCGWAVRRFEEPPGSPVPPAGRFRGGTDRRSWGAGARTGGVGRRADRRPLCTPRAPADEPEPLPLGNLFAKSGFNETRGIVYLFRGLEFACELFVKAGFCERKVGRRNVPPRRRA